jgi:phenylacetate-coenzyme A ligase PaaK-like adenylate-forming protein
MDDMIKLTTTEIFLDEIFNAVEKHPTLSSFFQILVTAVNEKTDLLFRIESLQKFEVPPTAEFIESVRQSIITSSNDLRTKWEAFLVKDFRVEIVPPLTIERVGRTGKIRRIVDTRQEG